MAISDLTQLWDAHNRDSRGRRDALDERYYCDWADRTTSKNELMGEAHSDYSWLYCKNVRITPLGEVASGGGPEKAILDVHWETRGTAEEEEANSDWTTWSEQWQSAGEAITVGPGYKWISDNSDVTGDDINATKLFPAANISLSGTVANFDAGAKLLILGCEGKLNEKNLTLKGFAYPSDHLLFLGTDANEGVDGEGNTVHGLTYKFSYHHVSSWNEFWRADMAGGPGWDGMSDANGDAPYDTWPFSDLDPANW